MMGSLDPMVDKPRTFALMDELHIDRAVLRFSGGNDEGGTEEIRVEFRDGSKGELEVWYCGGYTYGPGGRVDRMSEPADAKQQLSELLQGPVDAKYGTWAGDFSAEGTLTWDATERTCVMEDVYSEMQSAPVTRTVI